MSVLWTSAEMEQATLGRATRGFVSQGISIDTRTLKAERRQIRAPHNRQDDAGPFDTRGVPRAPRRRCVEGVRLGETR